MCEPLEAFAACVDGMKGIELSGCIDYFGAAEVTLHNRQDTWADTPLRSNSAIHGVVRYLAAALVLCSVSGCGLNQWVHNGFKVGPNYCKPAVPVAAEWIDDRNPSIQSVTPDLATWWTVFGDPALNDLIETASRQNITLRVAGMRIMEASAVRGVAAGGLFPQTQAMNGGYSRVGVSENVANREATPQRWFDQWGHGFNLSWELDFWGRFRRAIEAADAELDASIENYDDVMVLLLADVASSYVELRTFQERRGCAIRNVVAQENALRIAEDKFSHGAATKRDVEQAKTVLEQTRALVPQFDEGVRLANNRLCVLLGRPPQDIITGGLGETSIPNAPFAVAVGIPADLIRRRPDVRKAEREVAAQSARIGIAESDFYPHISIVGTLGWSSKNLADLYAPESFRGSVGPGFNWNILNYGRIVNNVRAQDARFQQAAYAYQEKVLQAGREAEDGIVKFLKSHERSRCLNASSHAAENTRVITTDQYRQGAVDFTAVFLAESELSQVQDMAATARGQIAQSLISVYRALGGGWDMRLLPQAMTEGGPPGEPASVVDREGQAPEPPTPPPAPPSQPEQQR
jgi:NodT family efflux transporter outer membrane factor (OMF) lipoprotein